MFSGVLDWRDTPGGSHNTTSGLASDIQVGKTFTGSFSFNDSASGQASSIATEMLYRSALLSFTVNVGNTQFTKEGVAAKYANGPGTYGSLARVDNDSSWYDKNYSTDTFGFSVWSYNDPIYQYLSTAMYVDLRQTGSSSTAFSSNSLAGINLNLADFTPPSYFKEASLTFFDYNTLNNNAWVISAFSGNITSMYERVSIGNVSGGAYSVPTGQQVSVSAATSGTINATLGSAAVTTLAGATLTTGSGGATVTTLTSGTINTSGGSITAQGGNFTGSITGNGGLTKTGTGTLVLNSANTYSGSTVIDAGTVEITVGDAIGSAPITIANNGNFRAVAGVAVTNKVVVTSTAGTYEHVLGGSDTPAHLAPITNNITSADIVAGDATSTTVTSKFNGNGSLSLHGLDNTKFLMVLDLPEALPANATPADYYLGWWNATANGGAGSWVNAVLGNHGLAGGYAGAYTESYQQFLSDHGGWNGTAMLGAYGLDIQNKQVWAVIDHNSDFGAANGGILIVPEPSTYAVSLAGIACGGWGLWRRRRAR